MDVSSLTVGGLRAELQERGLDSTGSKVVLVERLRATLHKQGPPVNMSKDGDKVDYGIKEEDTIYIKEEPIEVKQEVPETEEFDTTTRWREKRVLSPAHSPKPKKQHSEEEQVLVKDEQVHLLEETDQPRPDTPDLPSSQNSVGSSLSDTSEIDTCLSQIFKHDHPCPHLERFYGKSKLPGKVVCKECNKEITHKQGAKSNYNLKRHYETGHPLHLPQLLAVIAGASKRGHNWSGNCSGSEMFPRQGCIEGAFTKGKYDPNIANHKLMRFLIEELIPLHVIDSETFRDYVGYLHPGHKPPSRRQIMRMMDSMGAKAKSDLTGVLSRVDYCATTADSWSAHNRSFLGMTIHWICLETLRREKAVLGVKVVEVSQTEEYIGRSIMEFHQEFGIDHKVVATTTDNGVNYCSAFNLYAQADALQGLNPHPQAIQQLEVKEEDLDREVAVPVRVADLLEREAERGVYLPKHYRCGAHTINLLATTDVNSVPGWTSKSATGARGVFIKTQAKMQALWNTQNRKTVAAADIKNQLGRRLKTPVVTRWNSYYESTACLLKILNDPDKMEALNSTCQKQNPPIASFDEMDKQVCAEFVRVMKPLAVCLELLQAEEAAYMGILLPNLHRVRDQLMRMKEERTFRYAGPLINHLLDQTRNRSFTAKFSHLFDDEELLMASALHPHFKLGVMRSLHPEKAQTIQSKIIREVVANIEVPAMGQDHAQREDSDGREFGIFDYLLLPEDQEEPEDTTRDQVEKSLISWSKIRVPITTPLSRSLFPSEHRKAWVKVFVKYNTPLPSSAAVERLFSQDSDVLSPKRSSLTASNLNQLVFMKGNLKVLEMKKTMMRVQEEEDITEEY